jgi:hypothetical protein
MSPITRRNFALLAAFSSLKSVLNNGSTPKRIHIKNRRLFDLQDGSLRLEKWERHHLHECQDCQNVLYVFMTQPAKA